MSLSSKSKNKNPESSTICPLLQAEDVKKEPDSDSNNSVIELDCSDKATQTVSTPEQVEPNSTCSNDSDDASTKSIETQPPKDSCDQTQSSTSSSSSIFTLITVMLLKSHLQLEDKPCHQVASEVFEASMKTNLNPTSFIGQRPITTHP